MVYNLVFSGLLYALRGISFAIISNQKKDPCNFLDLNFNKIVPVSFVCLGALLVSVPACSSKMFIPMPIGAIFVL